MSETPFFSCEGLSLDLGGREVLSNIGLELRQGEVLGIIGPNGAGKTSLLEILSGRYAPKSGKVFLEERDINNLSLFQRARLGIGRTYQTPIVPEELTVGETMKRRARPSALGSRASTPNTAPTWFTSGCPTNGQPSL